MLYLDELKDIVFAEIKDLRVSFRNSLLMIDPNELDSKVLELFSFRFRILELIEETITELSEEEAAIIVKNHHDAISDNNSTVATPFYNVSLTMMKEFDPLSEF